MRCHALLLLTVIFPCGLLLSPSSGTCGHCQKSGQPAPGWQVTVTAKEKLVIKSAQGKEMICRYIAPGEFTMGTKEGYLSKRARDLYALSRLMAVHHQMDEGPLRETTITKGFFMLDTKVWMALYCEFLNETEEPQRYIYFSRWARFEKDNGKYQPKDGSGKMAVNTTTWYGAEAFCKWLSKKTGRTVRLPTEAEWEYAAKGKEGRSNPWGNKPILADGYGFKEVKTHPENGTPQKIYDMVGPIAEWCSDWYAVEYDPKDKVDPKGGPKQPAPFEAKVKRAYEKSTTKRSYTSPIPAFYTGISGFRFLVEE